MNPGRQQSIPKMTDLDLILQAGINPKTGLPLSISCESALKDGIRRALRVLDEQNAVNRYIHKNLPKGLESRLIERILYYRSQLALFRLGDNEEATYFALPYTLAGDRNTGIDVYGRFRCITPVPFNGVQSSEGEKEKDTPWVNGLTFVPLYGEADTLTELDPKLNCVIMRDYTEQRSQTSISRQMLNDNLLNVMAECIPFMRTALINGTGTRGIRVMSDDEASNVIAANDTLLAAALTGRPLVSMTGTQEFQELTSANVSKADEFMQAMQSLDNFRLSLLGCTSGGVFQKHEHTLQAEAEQNGTSASIVLEDGRKQRQEAWDKFNKLYGTNVTVEIAEGMDEQSEVAEGDYEQEEETDDIE